MAKKFTIFDSTASPQTGVGNGLGPWFKVRDQGGSSRTGQVADTETISLLLTGTPNGSTIKVVLAHDVTSSPLVYANMQNPQDAGTMVDVSMTTAGAFSLVLPSGTFFTLNISGSGSPLPAWTATVIGEIEAAS